MDKIKDKVKNTKERIDLDKWSKELKESAHKSFEDWKKDNSEVEKESGE